VLCLQLHTVRSAYTVHAADCCCAYSCTKYGLHTQYMLLTGAVALLCLQLHTLQSAYTVHADELMCLQLHTVRSPYTVHAADRCCCLAVPTAAHITVCIHSTCFYPMLTNCCAYSCTQYGLHTHYMLLTGAVDLLCLQLHTIRSPYTVHASTPC